ncbi:MAG: MAPEG family protein, partial [Halioglobus sp.]|nr:MAPEG family protein [Halioglobus sp.]
MNMIIVSLIILSVLPLLCAWTAGYYRQKQLGRVDNKEPRLQSLQLTGAGARAVAAQSNTWEALG